MQESRVAVHRYQNTKIRTIMNNTIECDLFTMATARAKRDTGIHQSSEHSGEAWKDEAISFVRDYLLQSPTLFVDALWEAGLRRPNSPRALGAVMQHARKKGWMEEQEVNGCILARPSASSNMQLKRVWKSRIQGTSQHTQEGLTSSLQLNLTINNQ